MKKLSVVEALEEFPNLVEEASKLGQVKIVGDINKILVCGVGDSGIAGELLRDYTQELGLRIPSFVNKDFEIPPWADSKTLVFIVSYSGNTLETIKNYRQALGKGCKIIVITSGGKLRVMAQENNIDTIKIPDNLESRTALPYLFIPMIEVLRYNNIIREEVDYSRIAMILRKPHFKEKAEYFAKKLIGKTPIIYSSKRFRAVRLRWKLSFNQNTKIPCFVNEFPEVVHNELQGYEEKRDDHYLIIIRDDLDNKYIKRQIDLLRSTLKDKVEITELKLTGQDYLTKLFSTIYLGDLVSVELAEILEKDIESLELERKIREKMKEIH